MRPCHPPGPFAAAAPGCFPRGRTAPASAAKQPFAERSGASKQALSTLFADARSKPPNRAKRLQGPTVARPPIQFQLRLPRSDEQAPFFARPIEGLTGVVALGHSARGPLHVSRGPAPSIDWKGVARAFALCFDAAALSEL